MSNKINEQKQWGFLRETTEAAEKAGIDKDTGVCRTGLNEYLDVIFPNQKWIHDKACGARNQAGNLIRPDYRCEELKLIVEFDGVQHYRDEVKIKEDIFNTRQYEDAGYKVVRIPYFIQLSNKAIKTLFDIDVAQQMFDDSIPSMGTKGKNTPATLCELGVKRMAREFLAFPEQYIANITALSKEPNKTGVRLLEEEYYTLINSTKILYHASTKRLGVGRTVSVDDYKGDTTFFYQSLDNDKKQIEELIESARPKEYVSRKKCIFFFEDPVYCMHFAKAQYKSRTIYVYEVAVHNVCGGFPMHIIGKLEESYKNGIDISPQINEYWKPTHKWECLEFFGSAMTVLRDVTGESIGDAVTHVANDWERYNRLYQSLQQQKQELTLDEWLKISETLS